MAIFIYRQGHEFIEFDSAQQCDMFGSTLQKQYFLYSAVINNVNYGPKRRAFLCIVENNQFPSIVNTNCH
jgi:hypothetical protein